MEDSHDECEGANLEAEEAKVWLLLYLVNAYCQCRDLLKKTSPADLDNNNRLSCKLANLTYLTNLFSVDDIAEEEDK